MTVCKRFSHTEADTGTRFVEEGSEEEYSGDEDEEDDEDAEEDDDAAEGNTHNSCNAPSDLTPPVAAPEPKPKRQKTSAKPAADDEDEEEDEEAEGESGDEADGPAAAAKKNVGGAVPKEDDLEEVEADKDDDE